MKKLDLHFVIIASFNILGVLAIVSAMVITEMIILSRLGVT